MFMDFKTQYMFFKDFMHLLERECMREKDQGQRAEGEGEDAPPLPLSKKPDVGLNLRTWDHYWS